MNEKTLRSFPFTAFLNEVCEQFLDESFVSKWNRRDDSPPPPSPTPAPLLHLQNALSNCLLRPLVIFKGYVYSSRVRCIPPPSIRETKKPWLFGGLKGNWDYYFLNFSMLYGYQGCGTHVHCGPHQRHGCLQRTGCICNTLYMQLLMNILLNYCLSIQFILYCTESQICLRDVFAFDFFIY